MQTVRNKWVHSPSEGTPASEQFRDADTLGRLLDLLDAEDSSRETVEKAKSEVLAMMAPKAVVDEGAGVGQQPSEVGSSDEASLADTTGGALFSVGELVSLRSDPSMVFPVIEVIAGDPEHRYTVFQNSAKRTYYESQLQSDPCITAEGEVLDVRRLHSHLTSLQLLSPSTMSQNHSII